MDYYGNNMVNRFERIMLYSPGEFRRRINGVCDIMKRKNVDVLIFLECAEEAYDEWLTGNRILEYTIVTADGNVIGVMWDEIGAHESMSPTIDMSRHVAMKQAEPVCDGISFIERISDVQIADILAAENAARIGLVSPQQMNAGLDDAIQAKLPHAEYVDLTIPVALFRAVKSNEELYVIQQARNVQVAVFEALPQMLRVGRSVNDINSEMTFLLMKLGASGVVHASLICNGQQDIPSAGFGGDPNHVVTMGDRYFALMEASGPGHHHIAFGRHFVLGDISPDWKKCVDDAVRIHKYAVSLMKPQSLSLAQIAVKTRKFANTYGYVLRESIGWNWMHSMGGYYYEQYSLEDITEDVPLRENILLHCHPLIYRELPSGVREDLFILNTYLLTADGAKDLVDVPMNLVSLY